MKESRLGHAVTYCQAPRRHSNIAALTPFIKAPTGHGRSPQALDMLGSWVSCSFCNLKKKTPLKQPSSQTSVPILKTLPR